MMFLPTIDLTLPVRPVQWFGATFLYTESFGPVFPGLETLPVTAWMVREFLDRS